MRKIKEIHLHHSWKPDYSNFKTINGRPNYNYLFRWIRDYHINNNKWQDIGYHYIVFPDGHIMDGRTLELPPASIPGRNSNVIAICMIGNFDSNDITDEQLQSTKKLIKQLMEQYKTKVLYFHREWSTKTCPGTKLNKDMFI